MQIKHLTLQAPDLIQLEPFYRETLGLSITRQTDDELTIKIGNTDLKFELMPQFDGAYHIAINVPENQFSQAVEWLTARVTPITDSTGSSIFSFPEWNAHSIYFYDPAGNVLELIARHDLPTASDKPFTSNSMLSISEVGLGAEDAPTLASHLKAEING
ncbi:MAG TPA: VOC family protein, partial [Phototrophicaceae bacterium]|nr:VOC family protein [Phototrophicaceae bacterium]